jgi:hypothetical protein
MKGLENILGNGMKSSDSATTLNKSKSLGSNSSQIKTRGIKNSIKDEPAMESGRKSAETPNNHIGDEEMMNNTCTNSSGSLTACTKEEQANKLKSEEKTNQKLSQMKNKDDKSPSQSSNKSEKSAKEDSKDKKPLAKERERICVQWIKDLSKLEAEKKNLPAHVPSDDMPMYCSNKICPISEQKIAKNPKVLNSAKKVVLRKVVIQEEDERWYCLKCLKAHNESLFCYYCSQIYFVGAPELEDDGKVWVLCDDCDKWVSKASFEFTFIYISSANHL